MRQNLLNYQKKIGFKNLKITKLGNIKFNIIDNLMHL